MTPYYEDDAGLKMKNAPKTEAHKRAISDGQRRAWDTKRKRIPLGSKNHDAHGYVRVKTRVGTGRWDKEHRIIVEGIVGRKLRAGEQIHHINGVRADNDAENLFLCPSGTEHNLAHASFEALLGGLLSDGIVRFDRATGRYFRCR